MSEKRISKEITNKSDIDFLLSIKEEDIGTSLTMDMFGEFNGKSKFNPYDHFKVPADSYGPSDNRNIEPFYTTVGIWVFNKFFIENDLFNIFGYISKTITKKEFKNINNKLSYSVVEDGIDLETLKRFIMKTQKNMPYVSVLSPSFTLNMLLSSAQIGKKKKELLKKYDKEIKEGNEIIAEKIEQELLDYARELLNEDPSMDSYNSGARGSFDNNFKNMYVMKGAIKDPDPTKGYKIATSNYMDGISKDEYATFANSLAAGPYARAKKTELGGHWEKLFLSAFQHIRLDKQGSDCGTKRYIEVYMNDDAISDYMYSYIIEGSNLVELTSKNMDKYKGKKVKIRFSSLCESKTGICNKCAGNLFHRIGIENIGMSTPIIPSTLKNLSMKSFHDSSVQTIEMDPMKAFGYK